MARLHETGTKGSPIRKPFLDKRLELKTLLSFAGSMAAVALAYATVSIGGLASGDSDAGLVLPFALGFIAVCALCSSLAFLVVLRHRLLLISLLTGAVAIGAVLLGIGVLESLAKILFAAATGLWIGLMLTSISQVLLIAGLIILVDIYSVFLGPTKKIVESGSRAVDWFTISLPVFGAPAESRVGISDIIFFAVFIACTLTYRLRRTATALAMAGSFVLTMIIGITAQTGVPALPLLSLAFLLANADVLYRRFLEEPDEHRRRR